MDTEKHVVVHHDVALALQLHRSAVALETAVLTHGLPREADLRGQAIHLAAMRSMIGAVRESGAAAAVIAVHRGRLCIGLEDRQLAEIAADPKPMKASTRELGLAIAGGATAGTTVAATLAACALCPGGPIRVMATGGIGGVHADWTRRLDVSADLMQLATTPVCVVCSGAKSILDVPATLEALEMLGVPIVGYETDLWPQFLSRGCQELRVPARMDSAEQIAELCIAHWLGVKSRSAIIVAQPPPAPSALDHDQMVAAIAEAQRRAMAQCISGQARTPFLLSELAHLTSGRSLQANLALLENNARLAGVIASLLARRLSTAPMP